MEQKVLFFDFMGTCLNWHASIVNSLPNSINLEQRSKLAIAWREAFFDEIHRRFEQNLPPEDIDVTHRRCLDSLLDDQLYADVNMGPRDREVAVEGWHHMAPWSDVPAAMSQLGEQYEVFVLANGTTRLQLDLAKSSGLRFDMMFSSQLLGLTKPDPQMYRKALSLVGVKPEEAVMVAAHFYDLRAARNVGLRTVYIRRWTEDTKEDFREVADNVDLYIGGSGRECVAEQDGSFTVLVEALSKAWKGERPSEGLETVSEQTDEENKQRASVSRSYLTQ